MTLSTEQSQSEIIADKVLAAHFHAMNLPCELHSAYWLASTCDDDYHAASRLANAENSLRSIAKALGFDLVKIEEKPATDARSDRAA